MGSIGVHTTAVGPFPSRALNRSTSFRHTRLFVVRRSRAYTNHKIHHDITCKAKGPKSPFTGAAEAIDLALPVAGSIALFLLGAPLLGAALPYVGLTLGVVSIAAVTGVLDKVQATYGIDPVQSAFGM